VVSLIIVLLSLETILIVSYYKTRAAALLLAHELCFAFGSRSAGSGTAVLYFLIIRVFCARRAQKTQTTVS